MWKRFQMDYFIALPVLFIWKVFILGEHHGEIVQLCLRVINGEWNPASIYITIQIYSYTERGNQRESIDRIIRYSG
jgi:hypothetical protein